MTRSCVRQHHRIGAALLFAALLVGCASNASIWTPANMRLDPQSSANAVRWNTLASEGFVEASSRPARVSTGFAPGVKGADLNVYWGDYYNNTIAVYSRIGTNPPEKAVITRGLSHPQRLFVDDALAIYATNAGNNTITVYKRHATRPSLRISTGIDVPTGLTVDAAGTVYCANVGNDTVTVYLKGQTTPSLTIPIAGSPEYLALDGSHNLYVSYLGGSKGTGVMEFAAGSTVGKDLGLDLSGGGALEIDRSGTIIIVDDYGLTIDTFLANATEPSRKIGLGGGAAFGLSLSEREHNLYVTVEAGGAFVVQQLSYPNLTALTTKLSTGAGNWPIAVSRDAVM